MTKGVFAGINGHSRVQQAYSAESATPCLFGVLASDRPITTLQRACHLDNIVRYTLIQHNEGVHGLYLYTACAR